MAHLEEAAEGIIREFLMRRHCRSNKVDDLIETFGKAIPATADMAVISSCSTAALALVGMLRQLRKTIISYDQQIETIARAHPEFRIFESLPGAGQVMVPRLIAALGTQRDRWQHL